MLRAISFVAIIPSVIEGLLIVDILVLLFVGFSSSDARTAILSSLLILGLVWAFETAITILHCRRYIRDFIPEKRDAAMVLQDAPAKQDSR
jgi:hypothetical protein